MSNFYTLLVERFPSLLHKTMQQTYMTLGAIFIAMCISIPIGIIIARKERIRSYVLGFNSILQTLPSLAVLGFLLPFLGIGIKTALVALVLYAMLPIMRNTVTGLLGLPMELLEAADGLGFTRAQKITMIELPLALPVIIAGIRSATAMVVGIATLAAFIGAGGLGDFIYEGLSLNNTNLILLGAIPAALLALFLDFLIAKLESALTYKKSAKQKKYRFALISFIILLLGMFGLFFYLQGSKINNDNQVKIGTKNFSEQLILGEIMAQLLEANSSLNVVRVFNLGGTLVCHQAILNGEIDLYPEYTGTSYAVILKQAGLQDPALVYQFVQNAYQSKYNLEWLDVFGFNNSNAVAVRAELSKKFNLVALSDLKKVAQQFTIGVPPDFMERPDGFVGLKTKYQMQFASVRIMDPGLMYKAIQLNQLDAIMAFSTDARIAVYHLVVLTDDQHLFPPYYAAPVIRIPYIKKHPEVKQILNRLAGKISNDTMINLNYQIDELKRSPAEVAREFLLKNGLVS